MTSAHLTTGSGRFARGCSRRLRACELTAPSARRKVAKRRSALRRGERSARDVLCGVPWERRASKCAPVRFRPAARPSQRRFALTLAWAASCALPWRQICSAVAIRAYAALLTDEAASHAHVASPRRAHAESRRAAAALPSRLGLHVRALQEGEDRQPLQRGRQRHV